LTGWWRWAGCRRISTRGWSTSPTCAKAEW
jgi:hypothetical protein